MTTQENLWGWLDELTAQYPVIAPKQVESVSLFRRISAADEVAWGVLRTVVSPKAWLFPDTEVLLEIEKRPGGVTLDEPPLGGLQILFAVRPCDARALRSLDAMLVDHPPPDAYYARRRHQTALVGLACQQPLPDCFCASTGGAPDDPRDMDVMMFQTDDGYLVQAVTERGASLLQGLRAEGTDRTPPPSGPFDTQVLVTESTAWAADWNATAKLSPAVVKT